MKAQQALMMMMWLAVGAAAEGLAKENGFAIPASTPAQPAPAKNVIPAEELVRRWNTAETRSLNAPAPEKRTTLVSDAHLAALQASGATRGIAVVPVGGGQNQITCAVDPASAVTFQNILFKLNSTELADAASLRQVEEIARAIQAAGNKSLVLEGHTCDLGTDGHNQSLSERRAAAIQAMLVTRGVSPAQLLPLGFGESRPDVPNTSDANREENRRVVVVVRQ